MVLPALTNAVNWCWYDTTEDSDGGAWRHRCTGTSWFNETLNTSIRGSRREFPAVALIVAEANKVTIYDGDDPVGDARQQDPSNLIAREVGFDRALVQPVQRLLVHLYPRSAAAIASGTSSARWAQSVRLTP